MDKEAIDIGLPQDDGQAKDGATPTPSNFKTPQTDPEELAKIKSELALIRGTLDTDVPSSSGGTGINLPLRELVAVMPAEHLATTDLGADADAEIVVVVPDLMNQLKSGRVVVTLANLVINFPVGLVAPDAYEDGVTEVPLPLPFIVASIDPNLMLQQNAHQKPAVDIAAIPDPFAKVETPPAVSDADSPAPSADAQDTADESAAEATAPATEIEEPVAEEPPEPAAHEEPAPVAEEPAPAAEAPQPVAEPEDEADAADLPEEEEEDEDLETIAASDTNAVPAVSAEGKYADSGVNLNRATIDQILSLEGVSEALAGRIVAYRTQNGPFSSVFDLKNVGRVGRITFRKMTGMPFSTAGHHRSERIQRLLSLPDESTSHLPTITRALAERPGFSGTIISNSEGLLLSEHGAADGAARVAAVVPKLVEQLADNLEIMEVGRMRSISIAFDDKMFTIIRSGAIYLTAIHERRKLTKSQLSLVHRVAAELEWILSHRAYVA